MTDTKRTPFRAKAIAEAKRMIETLGSEHGNKPITAEVLLATIALAFENGAEWGYGIGKGGKKR